MICLTCLSFFPVIVIFVATLFCDDFNSSSSSCSNVIIVLINTAQKMKFPINDFFSKCDQIRRKLRIWSYLMTKSLMENFIFCTV